MRPTTLLVALFSFVFPSLLLAVPNEKNTNEASPAGVVQERWRPAATFKVNSFDDRSDGSCDLVHCSLREAIAAANVSKGPDRIVFALPAAKDNAIRLLSPLPPISEALLIDGTTAASGRVEIDGAAAGEEAAGLVIEASWSEVKGLHLHGFAKDGLVLLGDLTLVEGNILGATAAGEAGNGGAGLRILSAQNVVGGKEPGAGNLVAGNAGPGIELWGEGAKENRIEGNAIGRDGAANELGVQIHGGAENNQIGSREAANEIIFNRGHGILVDSGRYNVVESNTIRNNGGSGVYQGKGARGAWVSANSIYDNAGPGIDAAPEHTEVRARIPRLSWAAGSSSVSKSMIVQFLGKPNTPYRVEFGGSNFCPVPIGGQKGSYFGGIEVTTDSAGQAQASWQTSTDARANSARMTAVVLEKGGFTTPTDMPDFDCNYHLIVEVSGQGTIQSDSLFVNCSSSSCQYDYTDITDESLHPFPAPGWQFVRWTSACIGFPAAYCDVTAGFPTNKAGAVFEPIGPPCSLTVGVDPVGGGSVSVPGAPSSCTGPACTYDPYACGSVNLTASPSPGWAFKEWIGECVGQGASCTILVDGPISTTAVFMVGPPACSVDVSVFPGGGNVSNAPRTEINCPNGNCSSGFTCGESVMLRATPSQGWSFSDWTGDCAGSASPDCSLTVNSPLSTAAEFVENWQCHVAVTKFGRGKVKARHTQPWIDDPIDCGFVAGLPGLPGLTCGAFWECGVEMILDAIPEQGWRFGGWADSCYGTGECRILVDDFSPLQANFFPDTPRLTLTKFGSGAVSGGMTCGSGCNQQTEYFASGTTVDLIAAPNEYCGEFVGWTGCTELVPVSGQPPICRVLMDRDQDVTVSFATAQYTLDAGILGTGFGTITHTSGNPPTSCTRIGSTTPLSLLDGSCFSRTLNCGSTVTFTAEAASCSTLTGWSGCDFSSLSPGTCRLTMGSNPEVVRATFTLNTNTITANTVGNGDVSSDFTTSPSINCPPDTFGCTGNVSCGSNVTLTARARPNSAFDHWEGDCLGQGFICNLTAGSNKSATAYFTTPSDLTVIKGGNGRCHVESIVGGPGHIYCDNNCSIDSDNFTSGSLVKLRAFPDVSSVFEDWSAPCSGQADCDVTMNRSWVVTAFCNLKKVELTVAKTGQGRVTSSAPDAGIDCGLDCTQTHDWGTLVTLYAAPDAGWYFTGWTGDAANCGTSPTCQVTLAGARSAVANFAGIPKTLTVNKSGGGNGVVASDDGDIYCNQGCFTRSANYPYGTAVTLRAVADSASVFEDWSAPCSGLAACELTMDQARTVTAFFRPLQYSLTVTKAGEGLVTGAGISCGSDCVESYNSGAVVTLSQSAASGWRFSSWSGACTGSGSCIVTMDAAKLVTATFVRQTHNLDVTVINPGGGAPQGAVSVSPPGSSCASSCTYTYDDGTLVTLEVTVPAGLTFTGWGGACSGTGLTCTVTVSGARSVTASFSRNNYSLDITLGGSGTGTVTGPNISCPGDCTETYPHGTLVTLTASPNASSVFEDWSAPCSGQATCVVTMDQARTVTAFFNLRRLELTVSTIGEGSVTSSPAGIDCGADCTQVYDYGTVVTLTPVAAPGWTFSGWGGACSGAGSCVVTIDAAKNVTATFVGTAKNLTITKSGSGTGTVTSAPAGINCGATCSASYAHGTQVTLTASPDSSSTFEDWSAPCSGQATCVVTMDQARTVTAFFNLRRLELTVSTIGEGSVTSSPAGIDCGADCTQVYDYGTVVTLTPVAAPGWTFSGWGGACSGAGSCVVTIDAAKNVTATFVGTAKNLTVTKSGSGTGTVTSAPAGINCGATCSASYAHGTLVTLTASPDSSSIFDDWSAPCSGQATCVVTMDQARTVTAFFNLRRLELTVSTIGEGSVTSSPAGIDCGADCTQVYDYGTVVTLTPVAAPGWTFTSWGGACGGAGSCVVTIDAAKTVTATFVGTAKNLTVTKSGSGTGTVTSAPAGINCGATCSASYTHGTLVTLTAAPDSSSTFEDWSAPCSGQATCVVTMDQARTVTAFFRLNRQLLTVTKTGEGSVTGPGINCGTDCTELYDSGTVVSLSQAAAPGWQFSSWGGACSGTGSCAVTMDAAKLVTATFVHQVHDLSLVVANLGGGAPLASVSVSPPGSSCTGSCTYSYDHDTRVTLELTLPPGLTFTGWSGGSCSGTAFSCTVTMDAARSVTASFSRNSYALDVTLGGPGLGSVTGPGITCPGDCTETFLHGTLVTLTATPAATSFFEDWSAPCSGQAACVVTMDQARTVTAFFGLRQHELTVSKVGLGTVTSSPAGIDCGLDCSELYQQSTLVTLSPSPAPGWTFSGWGGACSGTGSCVVTMDAAKLVTAGFSPLRRQLDLTVTNPAGVATPGSVVVFPPEATCAGNCSYTYDHGASVTLTVATPAGLDFLGWGGACGGSASTCIVTMDAAKTVSATFARSRHTLAVALSGSGEGAVASTPAGINCQTDCSETYDHGQVVTLTATAAPSSTFVGWSSPCSGVSSCVVTMDQAREITAFFDLRTYELAVQTVGQGTVQSTLPGIDCGDDCSETYNHGTSVTLTATPAPGWVLSGWTPTCSSPCSFTMDGPKQVTATFTPIVRHLDLTVVNPSGAPQPGSVTVFPPGSNCTGTCPFDYDHGTEVTLTASVPQGLTFVGWSGDCSGINETCVVTMDQARQVTATYAKTRQHLTVATSGSGAGSVSSAPAGINCLTDCAEDYDHGQVVTLTATAAPSSTFVGWSAPCLDQEPTPATTCTVTMTQAYDITATFDLKRFELTVSKLGKGSVASSPAGIDCGLDCTQYYDYGTVVSLSATPDPGWDFAGWTGVCSGGGACVVTLTSNKSVQARFTPQSRTLTVNVASGPNFGGGTITSVPAGINCSSSCSAEFPYSAVVVLTATPDANSTFEDWSGPCSGRATCEVTLDQSYNITAFFRHDPPFFELSVDRIGEGTVTSTPDGIHCGLDCSHLFLTGSLVSLTPVPAAGWSFAEWTGACTGSGACTVTMDAIKTVKARFVGLPRQLSVAKAGTGSGTIVSDPAGINCGPLCAADFPHDTRVTLTATADASSTFVDWTSPCSGQGTCEVTMDQARTITAFFVRREVGLTVIKTGAGSGLVTSSPAGINCSTDCDEGYLYGTTVTLSATPTLHSNFLGWSGACSGTGTCTVTITDELEVYANFGIEQRLLWVVPQGSGHGRVFSSPAGIDCGSSCQMSLDHGTEVGLTALPEPGSYLAGWTGCEYTEDGVCYLRMTRDRTPRPTFTLSRVNLEVVRQGQGGGTVVSAPAGLDCGNTCAAEFDYGTSVTLTASPDSFSSFVGWLGDCGGSSPEVAVVLTGAKTCAAVFEPRQALVTLSFLAGEGRVTSLPAGIDCSGSGPGCSMVVPAFSTLRLIAIPAEGMALAGWTGGCEAVTENECEIHLGGENEVQVQAEFQQMRSLTIRQPELVGMVIEETQELFCTDATCAYPLLGGTTLRLLARPAREGQAFVKWGGACAASGQSAECVLTLDQDQLIEATFTADVLFQDGFESGDLSRWSQ